MPRVQMKLFLWARNHEYLNHSKIKISNYSIMTTPVPNPFPVQPPERRDQEPVSTPPKPKPSQTPMG